jgi:hypothetical protein
MPNQPAETKKTAMKIALGAALGGALGITAVLRKGSNEQRAGALQGSSNEVAGSVVGAVRESPSPVPDTQHSALSTQHFPDHPDWEPLPAAHLPRPTYWPVVLAAGVVFLAWGIVTTFAISIIGLALLGLALGGWIGELRRGHE